MPLKIAFSMGDLFRKKERILGLSLIEMIVVLTLISLVPRIRVDLDWSMSLSVVSADRPSQHCLSEWNYAREGSENPGF